MLSSTSPLPFGLTYNTVYNLGMTVEYLIQTYGYFALFLGTFIEGEVVLVLGGFLAHRGDLSLPLVALAAFVGGAGGDQFYFNMARWRGKALLDRHPSWAKRLDRADRLVHRYGDLIIFGFRFLYGTRIAVPIMLGMGTSVPRWRFALLNMAGAAAWAATFSTLGYLFGNAMELLLGRIKRFEIGFVITIALLTLIVWAARHLIHWRRERMTRKSGEER